MSVKKNQERLFFLVPAVIALVVLVFAVKDLFFFDEDVFVTKLTSSFMQQSWQRSFLVKQFFKAENFFFGTSPAGYHIVTVFLHLANAVAGIFLFDTILGFFKTAAADLLAKRRVLLFFFIIFLFSAVHAEPMGYILAQGIMICTLFAQLGLACFIKGLRGKTLCAVGGGIFFAASLLCYEIAWLVPLMTAGIVILGTGPDRKLRKKGLVLSLLYAAVLVLWIAGKSVFISASLVADYGNITMADLFSFKICRNALLLFVRSFLPPAHNSSMLIVFTLIFLSVLFFALNRLLKDNKQIFRLSLLLVLLVVMAAFPAALFGIDTHDSESERYVYFSSVFAVMLIVCLTAALTRNSILLKGVMTVVICGYAFILLNTVNNYKKGGEFSKTYSTALWRHSQNVRTVCTINQPSQFKGALLLRALTRLPQKTSAPVTVLQEYMQYLFRDTTTVFITLSAKEPARLFDSLKVVQKSADSAVYLFPEAQKIPEKISGGNGALMIAALREDTLFIFR
ncbi:MAG: hypothetical protein U0V75_08675 [Ferruginibacter sp.]